jgi:lysophospholipase L1-like esterase
MNSSIWLRWSSIALLALIVSTGFAQTNATAVNACIVPTQRTDAHGTNRYLELSRRVLDCHGQSDVIFLGDSITQAWEVEGKEVWRKYYAPRHALNLGIGSDRTQHVLWRLDNGHLADLKPKVAVVLIGVNNIADDTYTPRMVLEGVTAVVQKLRTKLPETTIILLGIFPFHEDFHPQRAKALQVNQALRKLDDGNSIHFLDFGHLFIQDDGKISKDMMRDFVHLSRDGYQLWAEAMETTLAKLIGDQPVKP